MFPCHGQCAVWLKLFNPSTRTRNFGVKTSRHVVHFISTSCCCRAPVVVSLAEVGRGYWLGLVRTGLLCLLRCFVCLLGLLLRACFRLSLPLLGFFILLQLAPCLVRVCAGRGQPLCPWDRGDKVVSSCWWVRACFIHPETLFQTLSHFQKDKTCKNAAWQINVESQNHPCHVEPSFVKRSLSGSMSQIRGGLVPSIFLVQSLANPATLSSGSSTCSQNITPTTQS